MIRRVLSSAKTSWATSSACAKLAGKAGSVTKVRVHSLTLLITLYPTLSSPPTLAWELSHTYSLSWEKALMNNLFGNPLQAQGGGHQP